jgi:hypothetical protein
MKEKEIIDIVVPYVDSSDPNWQELYKQHAPKEFREDSNGKQRFRKNDLFKYWFRGVEEYAPWINNIFLLVQSTSQVPAWVLKTDKIKIITHNQFIPQEYMPIFSSQAIEMFLCKIPGLSEKFIYSNDDIYFIGPVLPEDYFTDSGVKTDFKISAGVYEPMPLWKQAIVNSGLLVNKEETESLIYKGNYITPMHVNRPYLKSKVEEVYTLYQKEILESITKFREKQNFTVYIYDFYMRKLGLTTNKSYKHQHFSNKTSVTFIANHMANPQINKVMCLNDTIEETDKVWENHIKQKFLDKYPKKSPFEV